MTNTFEQLCNEYRENARMVEELKNMNESIKCKIIALMGNNDTMIQGAAKAIYKSVISNRFNTTKFKSDHPEMYAEYSTETSTKRFLVS